MIGARSTLGSILSLITTTITVFRQTLVRWQLLHPGADLNSGEGQTKTFDSWHARQKIQYRKWNLLFLKKKDDEVADSGEKP
jgi:hypothetical protein